ncbi:MAG: hypothetical protein AW09_001530 [Candidatus Accumulibacter phosphatis]|uniref:Phage coat protein n=1 Tax=Candidatus Accumulibacter phosphatis TaxID=327160 RepID=A0A080M7W9_9PROT|nr:MAG: hypothetical protein AW09_001530 [Candidatus Accumulibacter phosphatis]
MNGKVFKTLILTTILASAAGVVQADPVSYAAITSAVDVSTVATGIVAMGALMVVPNVARWAVRKLAGFFR